MILSHILPARRGWMNTYTLTNTCTHIFAKVSRRCNVWKNIVILIHRCILKLIALWVSMCECVCVCLNTVIFSSWLFLFFVGLIRICFVIVYNFSLKLLLWFKLKNNHWLLDFNYFKQSVPTIDFIGGTRGIIVTVVRRHEFKSLMRLIVFHISQMPLEKIWINQFSFQLLVNSRAD